MRVDEFRGAWRNPLVAQRLKVTPSGIRATHAAARKMGGIRLARLISVFADGPPVARTVIAALKCIYAPSRTGRPS